MYASSNIKPPEVDIEHIGDIAHVIMRRDITCTTVNDGQGERTEYSWEERSRDFPWKNNLPARIEIEKDKWWELCGLAPEPEKSVDEMIADANSNIEVLNEALSDLSEIVSESMVSNEDIANAVADLSELVSNLMEGEE